MSGGFAGAPVDEARAERARRAVGLFRRMLPQMTGFAQVITRRDDVQVQVGSGNFTDGKTIFMRPPIELGDEAVHDLRLCKAGRTDTGPICPACLQRENVMMGLYHEIAHIAFDSFAPVSEADKLEAIDHAIAEREADDARAALIKSRIEAAPSGMKDSYKALSGLVSPHLPNLVNAMEDYRVNRELTAARPGTREAFFARYRRVFAEGIEEDSGNVRFWNEAPHNSQAVVGIFAALCGLDYRDYFAPEVVAMLDSDDVQAVLDDVRGVRSAAGVYSLAFPVLEAMRKHGFCKRSDDPEPEPEPQPETDEERPESGDGTDEDSKPNPDREEKPEHGDPCDDGDPSESDDDGDGEPGGEDGDTDDPADEDSTGDSDGDASEDDDGDGSGAGDSDDADGDEGEQGDNAGITGTGDIEDDAAGGDGDSDSPSDDSDSDSAPTDGDSDSDSDSDSAPSTDGDSDSAPDGDSTDAPADTDGDSDDDAPAAGTDPGESKLEEEHVDTDGQDAPPFEADGEPEEAERDLERFLGHTDHEPQTPAEADEQRRDEVEVERAIAGEAFDSGSATVFGIRHHHWDRPYIGADGQNYTFGGYYGAWGEDRYGYGAAPESIVPPESVLGPALMQMRAVFADNSKWKRQTGLRSGRVNSRTLGRRVVTGDDRLFHKRDRPGKKDYHVVIGLDISGSTRGGAIHTIKAAAYAQAELCRRAGISFEMYAHTGSYHDREPGLLALDIFHIKDANEPWDKNVQQRLEKLHGSAANLDGHTLEFYRKQLDASTATDKIIMYYTDGCMPAENYHEELAILQREIAVCKRKGYTLMAVGIGNDDPVQYGLDTCRIDRIDEVRAVVKHLEKRLVR